MRKFITTFCLLFIAMMASAIPAKRGLYTTLKLDNGLMVKAQLCGDEHMRFYLADDGTRYVRNAQGTYSVADMTSLRTHARSRRAAIMKKQAARRAKAARKWGDTTGPGLTNGFYGKKKGLIILVQFSDSKFQAANNQAFYNNLANKENFTEGKFVGSVHDYFRDQSNGQFDLTFDVVGPVTMPKGYAYYGQNDRNGDDAYVGAMVVQACKSIDSQVNFADYDWDGDGEVDQVFVVYAGMGEADFAQGGEDYIWPHMYYLSESDYGSTLKLDGVTIDTYACSNEITPNKEQDGMGTICHEFSHCLGFPDLYDVDYSGGYGMGYDWDLMHGGNGNGNSFCPAGYSGYEKWIAGWTTPIELTTSQTITDFKPQSENGQTYIIYNEANRNEFYFIDNRQPTHWDAELPGKGLLVTHVNYNQQQWLNNTLNDDPSQQNWTIIAADNKYGDYDEDTDTYPYVKSATNVNDSLTNTSKPAAVLYNKNVDGTKLMGAALLGIKQNTDLSMTFTFRSMEDNPVPIVKPGNAFFYESFNNCTGNAGWSGTAAAGAFTPDNEGWDYYRAYGGAQCARFGTSSAPGTAITPVFYATGKARLTCKAGAWKGQSGTLTIEYGDEEIYSVKLPDQQWTDISVDFEADGDKAITFSGIQRLFLDEVMVSSLGQTDGITDAQVAEKLSDQRIFTIDGRFMGTDKNVLPHGLYIMNGKKFVK